MPVARLTHVRSLTVVIWALCLSWALAGAHTVWAGPPTSVRTTVSPTVGARAGLHPRVALEANAQTRILADDAGGPGDPAGVAVDVGPNFLLGRLVSMELRYAYAWGVSPVEGPGKQEHRAQLGFSVGTGLDHRVVALLNRSRLDLRTYQVPDEPWTFHLRPRNLTAVIFPVRPWLRPMIAFEALMQPDLGWVEGFQVRTGGGIDGEIELGARDRDPAQAKPAPKLRWFANTQAALSPIAMGAGQNRTVDLLVTFGVTGSF